HCRGFGELPKTEKPQKAVLAEQSAAGFLLRGDTPFDFGIRRAREKLATEHHMGRSSRDAAPQMSVLPFDLPRGQSPWKSGEGADDGEGFFRFQRHAFFRAGFPVAAFSAVLAAGSALDLLFADGFDCDRLAF